METETLPSADIALTNEPPVLLHSLGLSNFLSFGPNAKPISLGSLNVLIGPNGSGKSNLIEAISLLRSCPVPISARGSDNIQSIISKGGGVDEWIWKGSTNRTAGIDAVISGAPGKIALRHSLLFTSEQKQFHIIDEYVKDAASLPNKGNYYRYRDGGISITLGDDLYKVASGLVEANVSILAQRNDPQLYPELSYLAKQYAQIAIYRNWTFGRNTVFRDPQRADLRTDRLEEDFSNLGLFLNRLLGIPKVKRKIIERLQDVYDELDDIHINVFAGNVQIFFNEGDFQIPSTRISDGTMRYLCLLAILCDPAPPPLICIEEPELGLHPDLLPKIADLLRNAATRTQLIITTHSPILIDALTEEPETVLVCEKHDGQTEITRLSRDDLAQWTEKYRLGELWTRGEIGGTRW